MKPRFSTVFVFSITRWSLLFFLWKVKGCHYFTEALLIIISKTKHNINHYLSKDTFSNHKERIIKQRMLSRLYFPFLFLQQRSYWRIIQYIFRGTIVVYKIKETNKKEHNTCLISSRECYKYNWTTQEKKHKRKRQMSC